MSVYEVCAQFHLYPSIINTFFLKKKEKKEEKKKREKKRENEQMDLANHIVDGCGDISVAQWYRSSPDAWLTWDQPLSGTYSMRGTVTRLT